VLDTAPDENSDITKGFFTGVIAKHEDLFYICEDATEGEAEWAVLGTSGQTLIDIEVYTVDTASEDTFATDGYIGKLIEVFLNGVLLNNATDLDLTDGSDVVLNTPAVEGDVVTIRIYTPFEAENLGTMSTQDADDVAITGGTINGIAVADLGTILQVLSTTKTDTFTTTADGIANATTITGLSGQITTLAGERIIVRATLGSVDVSGGQVIAFRFVRDSTPIGIGAVAGDRPSAGGYESFSASDTTRTIAISAEDIPGAGTFTYALQVYGQGGTIYINRNNTDTDASGIGSTRTASLLTIERVVA
jgi:hypothetical protein